MKYDEGVLDTHVLLPLGGGGGGLPYKKGGDARRKISIEPLKGTNLGVA